MYQLAPQAFDATKIGLVNVQRCLECLLLNVTNQSDVISSPANILINIFQRVYGADLLLPLIIKILFKDTLHPTNDNTKVDKLVSTLEVLMVLLKDAPKFVSKPKNVK